VVEERCVDTTGNEFEIFSIPEGWQDKRSVKPMMRNTKITGRNYRMSLIPATPAEVDKCAMLLNAFQGYRFAQPLANGWHPCGMQRHHFSQHLTSNLSGSELKSAFIGRP
jgi:hypothetical protein